MIGGRAGYTHVVHLYSDAHPLCTSTLVYTERDLHLLLFHNQSLITFIYVETTFALNKYYLVDYLQPGG